MAIDSAFTLTANDIFSSLANMIISQEVFADNFGKHQTLVDKARVDGSMFGDRKLYYAVKPLKTVAWTKDSEAANLLNLSRPDDPKVQAIVLDKFRMITLTIDNYLTKRAWSTEGAFASFNSVMLQQMRETKRIYDGTNYNVYIGTTVATGAGQSREITIDDNAKGQSIAEGIANLLVEMGDYSKDFNDYGFLRSYADNDVKVVWNSKYVNEIKKVDTPTIFHREGLVDKLDEDVIPAKYFGHIASASDKGTGKVINANDEYDNTKGTLRAAREIEVTESDTKVHHYFAGEEITNGETVGASKTFAYADVYVEDNDIICKVLVKLPPYMSGFEASTSFFNPRSLTETHYLIFLHNTLAYLQNYPLITVKAAAE